MLTLADKPQHNVVRLSNGQVIPMEVGWVDEANQKVAIDIPLYNARLVLISNGSGWVKTYPNSKGCRQLLDPTKETAVLNVSGSLWRSVHVDEKGVRHPQGVAVYASAVLNDHQQRLEKRRDQK